MPFTSSFPLSIFFFNDTATTEIYTLSLHDALPIYPVRGVPARGIRHRDGDLRRGRDGGPNLGPDARRLYHGRLRLAVDLLHQHPDRHAGPGSLPQFHPELAVPGKSGSDRLFRVGTPRGGDRHPPDDALARA